MTQWMGIRWSHNSGVLEVFCPVNTKTICAVEKAWPLERSSPRQYLQVFVSVSLLIKCRRSGVTVKAIGHACGMQACQGFSTWLLSLPF